jgi:tRNA(Leu) C34 or U34 (ribose-2'-O)-methylase TrmL
MDYNQIAENLERYFQLKNEGSRYDRRKIGSCAIGLQSPRKNVNIGSVFRAAGCFGANMIAIAGKQIERAGTDVNKDYMTTPVLQVEELRSAIPYCYVPVAIELVDSAVSLVDYVHPPQAFYIFGGENMTLGRKTLEYCRDVVYIPTDGSLNLAMCVNVVLYDRLMKVLKAKA